MIKKLDNSYFNQCLEIALLKNKVSGTKPVDKSSLENYIKKYFENKNYAIFGSLNENELISWISIIFHENKTRGKFWAITSFFSKKFKTYFKFENFEYDLLLRHCIDYAENAGYSQFYYAVSTKVNNVFSKQWKKNKFSLAENYYIYDIDIIPKNTKPESELYWRLMGEETKPDDIIIKHRIRKNLQ